MRKLSVVLLAAALLVGLSGPSQAATLSVSGSTFAISVGALPPIVLPQALDPVPVFVSSGGGGFVLHPPIFAATVPLPTALFTGVPLISGLTVIAAGPGTSSYPASFGPGQGLPLGPGKNFGAGGGFGGQGFVNGVALVNVLKLFNLSVPLSAVGFTSGSVATAIGGIAITVTATNWTTGQVMITGVTTTTPGTVVTNTVTRTGSDNRIAAGGKGAHQGTVVLITPFRVVTNVAGNLASFATMTLRFVPEPGTLLLLGSGVAGLALLGRRRMRK